VKVVGGGSFEVTIAVRKNIEMFKPENLPSSSQAIWVGYADKLKW
jgi:hypothetical protein